MLIRLLVIDSSFLVCYGGETALQPPLPLLQRSRHKNVAESTIHCDFRLFFRCKYLKIELKDKSCVTGGPRLLLFFLFKFGIAKNVNKKNSTSHFPEISEMV